MKHVFTLLAILTILLCSHKVFCQTDTVKAVNYVEVYYSVTNTPGVFLDKSNLSVEFGRQWGVFSAGVDIGKTTLIKSTGRDTSIYVEVRPNLNVFQQGRFTNTLTVGLGYVFNCKNSMLTELTSGIEYSLSNRVHLNANFGQFYYSGTASEYSVSFFGLSASYYFLK